MVPLKICIEFILCNTFAVDCWNQVLFSLPCPVSIFGQWEFCQSVLYLGSSFCGLEIYCIWPLSSLVLSFLSLSFVDIFLSAKRKEAIFIFANFDRRMCCYFVPKVIILGSPLLGLGLWGKCGRSVVLLAHVACFAHTAVLFFCCCIFTTPDIPPYRNSFPEVSALYCIILFAWFFF